jgi:hypothetical protein
MMDNIFEQTFREGKDFRDEIFSLQHDSEHEVWGIIKTVNEINRLFDRFHVAHGIWDYLNKEYWYARWTSRYARVNGILTQLHELWVSHRYDYQLRHQGLVRNVWNCPVCGRLVENRPGHYHVLPVAMFGLEKGDWICNSCSQGIYTCDDCEKTFFDGNPMYLADNSTYCIRCWNRMLENNAIFICDECGAYAREQDITPHGDYMICLHCYDGRALFCVECDSMLFEHVDNIRWHEDDPYCRNCYSENAVVAEYDYFIPNPPFLQLSGERDRPDSLFFGCEFEIEMDWGKAYRNGYGEPDLGRIMKDGVPNNDMGYVKHDGSMRHGVEYVTHPMSEQWYRRNRKMIDTMFENWKVSGFRTDQFDEAEDRYNCSLHIHMSKAAFTTIHLYKFCRFFYKIPLRKMVQAISQRAENEFAQWVVDDLKFSKKMAKEKKNISRNRYSVINLIGGHWHEHQKAESKTVEFRLFNGSMDPQIVHKNIEFMLAVYYFTRDNSITHITQKNFIRYLREYRNRYRYLINFLNNELGKGV